MYNYEQRLQPSRPILPQYGWGQRQGRPFRPHSRKTERGPPSTVIGLLLFIFRRDPIEPNNGIQALEFMKSWVQRA